MLKFPVKSGSTIFIDLDNTTVDLTGPWLELYNQEFDDNVTPADIKDYDVGRYVKSECSRNRLYGFFSRPGFFRNLPALPGAVAGIRELVRRGYNVYIATSPPHSSLDSMREKTEWVRDHFPELRGNVILLGDKGLLRGDILFDDAPEQLERFQGVSVCMAQPYNEGCGDYRVGGWSEFLELLLMGLGTRSC